MNKVLFINKIQFYISIQSDDLGLHNLTKPDKLGHFLISFGNLSHIEGPTKLTEVEQLT